MRPSYPPLPAGFFRRHPAHIFAFGFGAGAIPFAPGTWGTLVAVPFCLLLQYLSAPQYVAFLALTFLLGVWLCQVAGKNLGVSDHPGMVWDEMVGYWIAVALVPPHWTWWLAAFTLFRIFDIWKPWPISELDRRLHGGLGVMADDALAGIFTGVILFAAHGLLIAA